MIRKYLKIDCAIKTKCRNQRHSSTRRWEKKKVWNLGQNKSAWKRGVQQWSSNHTWIYLDANNFPASIVCPFRTWGARKSKSVASSVWLFPLTGLLNEILAEWKLEGVNRRRKKEYKKKWMAYKRLLVFRVIRFEIRGFIFFLPLVVPRLWLAATFIFLIFKWLSPFFTLTLCCISQWIDSVVVGFSVFAR